MSTFARLLDLKSALVAQIGIESKAEKSKVISIAKVLITVNHKNEKHHSFNIIKFSFSILAYFLLINSAFASTLKLADISMQSCEIVEGKKVYSPDNIKFTIYWNGVNALVKAKDSYGPAISKLNCSFIDTRNWVCGGDTDFLWDPQFEGGKKYFSKDVYQKIDGKFSLIESKFKDGTLFRLRFFPKSCEPKIN